MKRKGCGPYNLGAPKTPAKYASPAKQWDRPTQEQRNALKDKSRLTDEERKVINREATLKEKGQAFLYDRNTTAELDKNIRQRGFAEADNIHKEMQKKQWLKDSAKAVQNRFFEPAPRGSHTQGASGNTGSVLSQPYIDQITGSLSFKAKKRKNK